MLRLAILLLASFVAMNEAVKIIEGDIAVDARLLATMSGRKPLSDGIVTGHWTGGVVPYQFSSNFDYKRREVVYAAIKEYEKYTCVRFVPRSSQRNYVEFIIGGGCYSYIGMAGNRQPISIGYGCESKGIVIHEMMHAIGFYHEQSRLDRDDYIYVNFNNIPSSVAYNFKKYSHGAADYYGEKYDYNSIMHYGNKAFGNGRVTITARDDPDRKLGQRYGFSPIDARQINKMYKCSGITNTPAPITKPPCVDRDNRCKEWAKSKQCHYNPSYMKSYCPQSCGLCKGKNTPPPPTRKPVATKTTTRPTGKCKDSITYCNDLVKNNYCTLQVESMKLYCKKSCNFCSGTTSQSCYDSQASCVVWAKHGHCSSNPPYMRQFCKKSCNAC